MLKCQDKVFKRLGLTYFLDEGTLLGAVRHGGWVPWDDTGDMDLGLLTTELGLREAGVLSSVCPPSPVPTTESPLPASTPPSSLAKQASSFFQFIFPEGRKYLPRSVHGLRERLSASFPGDYLKCHRG